MGQINFNPFKKAVQSVQDFFAQTPGRNVQGGGLNLNIEPSLYVPPGAGLPKSQNIPGYNFTPYQIKTGDTFENIATQNGMTVQQIQNANGNMTVPPPKGSYVNIPQQATVYQQQAVQQSYDQYVQDYRFSGTVNNYLAEYTANLTKQLQKRNLPASIPYQATKILINPKTGKIFTDADYQAEGYVYNNQKQSWELPGANTTSNPQTQTLPNQPAYLQIVNYNGKQIPAWQAELYAKRAARKDRERALAALAAQNTAQATNAGTQPTTTTDLKLAGG